MLILEYTGDIDWFDWLDQLKKDSGFEALMSTDYL
jgi:hypothetical protein